MTLPNIDREALWDALADRSTHPEHIQDWIGNRWPSGSFPSPFPSGWQGPQLPHDGDGFRAGAIEWLGFAIAAHYAAADDRSPTAVEMGASQAPWCLSWIRAMRKLGARELIRAIAYEAGDGRSATERFWGAQGLAFDSTTSEDGSLRCSGDGWVFEWRPEAIMTGGGTVRFPDVDIAVDNGAQATRTPGDLDYRGRNLAYRDVTAADPTEVVIGAGFVHFLHLDIQGAEEEIIREGAFREIAEHVAVVQLGTHSRTAEGLAFDELGAVQFSLVSEEPCMHLVIEGRPVLVRDGEQLWVSADVANFLGGWVAENSPSQTEGTR